MRNIIYKVICNVIKHIEETEEPIIGEYTLGRLDAYKSLKDLMQTSEETIYKTMDA